MICPDEVMVPGSAVVHIIIKSIGERENLQSSFSHLRAKRNELKEQNIRNRQNFQWKETIMGTCYYPEHWWQDDYENEGG